MKILMVSPYPPARDGVANYAAQVAAGLRAQGHRVAVVSPTPSAAAHHQPLQTIRGTWRAARLGRRADKTIVQFQPEAFFSGMRLDLFVRHWIGLMVLFSAGGNVEVVVHEAPYSDGGRAGAVRERMWRRLWQQPAALAVHTEAERDELVANLGVKEGNIKLIGHGDHFTRRSTASKADAREQLGIDPDAFVFLSIGFLQPHKGFDRTARGLARLDGANLRLDIVGEVRVRTPEHDRYIRMLEDLAAADPRVHLHREYVSDEQFDAWIIAADALVLPYREIWSSGVVERAALYDRPVVVTDVGGLPGQVDGALVARDAGELVEAMAKLSGAAIRPEAPGSAEGSPAARASALVRRRGEELRLWHDPLGSAARPALDLPEPADIREAPLALSPLPPPIGVRPFVMRVVRRFTRWQLDPLVRYVNALRDEVLGTTDGDDPPAYH